MGIMKTFHCHKCNCYLGEVQKGKIKHKSVILCSSCFERYKILEDLQNYNNASKKSDSMPDFLKDLMGGKL